ncbi:MAG: phosphoribosylanthranilate isomerase [Gemmatimonadota bacterium]|nr:phosphoribosylanthranilate isomerase [Gemmatimonadota bacterium]
MLPSTRVRIKICCIASVDEAWMAIDAGASAIGLVSAMPSGPGPIPESRIAEIAAVAPPGIATFLLTCSQDVDAIVAQQKRTGANTLQLVDRVEPRDHRLLREALPGISIVQVIHVRGADALDEAREAAEHVHAILLDSGNPSLSVKELGGTGRTHDWQVSRAIREAIGVPLFLAGGLNPTNVAEAIRVVRPFGVDVCSGLRRSGALDQDLAAAFCRAVQTMTA